MRRTLFIILILSFAQFAFAERGKLIKRVDVFGNRKTSTTLIINEMRIKEGQYATSEMAKQDELHLQSMGLFNKVTVSIVESEGEVLAWVTVSEPFYIYVFPILDMDFRESKRSVYGATVTHKNLRGRGEQVIVSGYEGKAEGVYLGWQDQWFQIRGNHSLGFRFLYSDSELGKDIDLPCPDLMPNNEDQEHRQKNTLLGVTGRRRLDLNRWIGLDLSSRSMPVVL